MLYTAICLASAAILGLLVWFVPLMGRDPGAMSKATRVRISDAQRFFDYYRAEHGSMPTAEQLTQQFPIIQEGNLLSDAWGIPFEYSVHDGKLFLISAGPDKAFDTKDDITN